MPVVVFDSFRRDFGVSPSSFIEEVQKSTREKEKSDICKMESYVAQQMQYKHQSRNDRKHDSKRKHFKAVASSNVNVFGVQLLVSASVDFVDNDGPEHLIRLQDIYYAPEGNHGVVHHHGGQLPFLFIGDPQPSGNDAEGAGSFSE